MATVLIIDDDAHIRELLRHFLSRTGFQVQEAPDGAAALKLLEADHRVDCAILDVMMPRVDGWELCRILKRSYDFPVLMLTAKGETAQKVKGLNLGADDYLAKPFDMEELLARVRALLRRYRIADSHTARAGTLTLDGETRAARAGDKSLDLPQKEFELLFMLARRPGVTVSRDQLIEGVWGTEFTGNERTLDVHVSRLRERFPDGRYGFRIATVRGLGYRLELAS